MGYVPNNCHLWCYGLFYSECLKFFIPLFEIFLVSVTCVASEFSEMTNEENTASNSFNELVEITLKLKESVYLTHTQWTQTSLQWDDQIAPCGLDEYICCYLLTYYCLLLTSFKVI